MNQHPKMLYLSPESNGQIAEDEAQEDQMREEGFKTYAEWLDNSSEPSVYESLTIAELKTELDSRGIDFKVNDTKPVLIGLLVLDDETD